MLLSLSLLQMLGIKTMLVKSRRFVQMLFVHTDVRQHSSTHLCQENSLKFKVTR